MKPSERALAARRRQRNLMTAIGVLALVLLFIASFKSYGDLRLGRGRQAALQSGIEASEKRIEALEEKVERLRTDPAMLEQLAREELLMARPGDVVIVLPASDRVVESPGSVEGPGPVEDPARVERPVEGASDS